MAYPSQKTRGWLAVVSIAFCASAALTAISAPSAGATSCGDDVVVLGARGSGQLASDHNGLGSEVDVSYTAMKQRLSKQGYTKVRSQAVDYPAADVKLLKQGRIAEFFNGLQIGVDNALTQLYQIQNGLRASGPACLGPRIVLMGYSQGAMVMHRVLQALSPDGSDANVELLARVGAALLLADGDQQPGDTANLYPANVYPRSAVGLGQRYRSISSSSTSPLPLGVRDRTYEVCWPRDVVCDSKTGFIGQIISITGVGAQIHGNNYRDRLATATSQYGAVDALSTKITVGLKASNTPPPSTTPPTVLPPSTTQPTTAPISNCAGQPEKSSIKTDFPPAVIGIPYDAIWRIPELKNCNRWNVTAGPIGPFSFNLQTQEIVAPDGTFVGLHVSGTPRYLVGQRTGSLVIATGEYPEQGGRSLYFNTCWGLKSDDGTYACDGPS